MKNIKKYFAEFIGTAVIAAVSCAVAMSIGAGKNSAAQISFAFGLSFMGMYYCLCGISACNFNPAVSIAMMFSKRISGKDCFWYIISQALGAFAGLSLIALIWSLGNLEDATNTFFSSTTSTVGTACAFIVELLTSFVIILVSLGATEKKANNCASGMAIAFTYVTLGIFSIPLVSASSNVARSFASALISSIWGNKEAISSLWVFVLAALLASILASAVYSFLRVNKSK